MRKSVANAWALTLTFALLPRLVHAILATSTLSWSVAPVVLDVIILATGCIEARRFPKLLTLISQPRSVGRIACLVYFGCV